MKGIIFNLFEEVLTQELGEKAWDDVLDRAGLEGSYTSLGNYSDQEFLALLRATPKTDGVDDRELLRWFGRISVPLLAERYPVFFDGHASTRSFLLTLNDIIHPEVRRLYPGADVPVFDFNPVPGLEVGEDGLTVGYRSPRRLCALAEGFIQGAAEHFGEHVTIEQPECMSRGDERCALVCTFGPPA